MVKKTRRIDAHHHILPGFYLEKLKSIGVTKALGVALSNVAWSPEDAPSFMSKMEIETG